MTASEKLEKAMRELDAYIHEWIDDDGQVLVAVYRKASPFPYALARGASREEAETDALATMGLLNVDT